MVPEEDENTDGDVFAKKEDEHEDEESDESKVPDTFEELPIEIRSLTERYLLPPMSHIIALTSPQVPRIPHSQSTSHPPIRRRPRRSLPRLLRSCLRKNQHTHSYALCSVDE
jgi:hypothetical protein